MASRAEIIDAYFREKDYFPWIDYKPIGQVMVEEIERQGENGLYLSTGAALVEKESGGKPIMGCDWGPRWTDVPPYCHVEATKERVQKLIKNVEAGGGQNGVSYCQLTTISYVYEAEKMGGAHLPRYQMRVGFRVLLDHILNLGWPAGAAAYNAGAGNWRSVINTYGASMARLQAEWAERLSEADEEVDPAVPVKPYVVIYTKTEKQAEHIARNWQRRGLETETGGGDAINLSKYKPSDKYGLTPHTDRVRQHLQEKFGPFAHVEGYRPANDGTEHNTRRSFDIWWTGGENHDGKQAIAVSSYVVENRHALMCEGITQANSQIGWERGYSDWSGWVRQFFQPTGWTQTEIDRRDAYHWRHGHYQFWK